MSKGRRQKAHGGGHDGNAERWLLTYADLITLLMVFFVVLYSMSRADTQKFARLQAALQKAFKVEVLKGNDPTALQGQDGQSPLATIIQEAVTQPMPWSLD